EVDQHARTFRAETLVDTPERPAFSEYVVDHVLAMEPREDVAPIADRPVNHGKVLYGIERGCVGNAAGRADGCVDTELRGPLDQSLPRLPVGDQVGDRNDLEIVLAGEGDDLFAALDGTIVVDQLGNHANRRQPGELGQIDGRLCVP